MAPSIQQPPATAVPAAVPPDIVAPDAVAPVTLVARVQKLPSFELPVPPVPEPTPAATEASISVLAPEPWPTTGRRRISRSLEVADAVVGVRVGVDERRQGNNGVAKGGADVDLRRSRNRAAGLEGDRRAVERDGLAI